MSHEKPTEEIRELAALFSLGVLTQHEADSFEAHIREGCPVCEAEYYRFKHITAEIGLAVNEADPPDYIRKMILDRVKREPSEEAPGTESEKEKVSAPTKTAAASRPALSQREMILARLERKVPEGAPGTESEKEKVSAPTKTAAASRPIFSQPPIKRRSIFPWILAFLFAVAAAAAFYAYYSERVKNDRLKTEISDQQSEKTDLQSMLDRQKNSPGELEQIISVVSKPETRIFHMAGLGPVPSASGAMLWDVQQNKCLIFGYIPPAPRGKDYQLWFLTSKDEKIPSNIVKTDSTGRIYDWFPIPEDISGLTMVITLEPGGGSKIPTLPYYAIGRND